MRIVGVENRSGMFGEKLDQFPFLLGRRFLAAKAFVVVGADCGDYADVGSEQPHLRRHAPRPASGQFLHAIARGRIEAQHAPDDLLIAVDAGADMRLAAQRQHRADHLTRRRLAAAPSDTDERDIAPLPAPHMGLTNPDRPAETSLDGLKPMPKPPKRHRRRLR